MSSIKPFVTSRKTGGKLVESRDLAQEYLEKEMGRRALLQGALATAAIAGCGTNPGNTPTPARDAGMTPTDTPVAPQDVPPARTAHLVGVGQHDDHLMAAEAALAETAGFNFVQRGQTVYLKVNTNSGDVFPYSTSPDMIRWVVGKLRERGAEVFIGDRSFFGDRGTMANFTANGIAAVARELSVPLHVFGDTGARDTMTVDWMDLPMTADMIGERAAVWDGTMRVPTMVAQADHIINMACVKTHFIATFTMSMKNIIGIINPVDRSRTRNLGSHDGRAGGRLYPQVAFMNKALPTSSLVVLDGWESLVTGGPTPNDRPSGAPSNFAPRTEAPHVVIISRDRLAADITGAGVLKLLSPSYELITRGTLWANRQISVALTAGVGLTTPEQYDLGGTFELTGARDMMTYDRARFREMVIAQ